MKLNYRLIKLSKWIIIVTLLITAILTFCFEETKLTNYINGILLNILAGAIILLVTSLFEYFSNRRKSLERLMKYVLEYRNRFSKIGYLQETTLLSYEEFKEKYNKDDSTIELMIQVRKEHDEYNKSLIRDFDKIINSYIEISEINFNDFWDIYADLHFIIKNKKITTKLYNDVFKYVYDEVNRIRELSYHLNIYKTEGASPVVMYEKIREYQSNIFYEKSIKGNKKLDKKNMQVIKSGIPYETIYGENKRLFVYNKMAKYLDEQYDAIGKIAYFDDNYNN